MRGPHRWKAVTDGGSMPCCTWAAFARPWMRCKRLLWLRQRGGDADHPLSAIRLPPDAVCGGVDNDYCGSVLNWNRCALARSYRYSEYSLVLVAIRSASCGWWIRNTVAGALYGKRAFFKLGHYRRSTSLDRAERRQLIGESGHAVGIGDGAHVDFEQAERLAEVATVGDQPLHVGQL